MPTYLEIGTEAARVATGGFLGITSYAIGIKLVELADKNKATGAVGALVGAGSTALLAETLDNADFSTSMKVGVVGAALFGGVFATSKQQPKDDDANRACAIGGGVALLCEITLGTVPAVFIGSIASHLAVKCNRVWQDRIVIGMITAGVGAVAINPVGGAILGGAAVLLNIWG